MEITIILTPERYDALTKTAELHLPDGTPEEYLQGVIDSACDSYVRTYPEVSLEVYKQRAEAAEAKAAQEAEARAAAEAKAAAAEPSDSLADKIGAL
jgi:hypothetical protein